MLLGTSDDINWIEDIHTHTHTQAHTHESSSFDANEHYFSLSKLTGQDETHTHIHTHTDINKHTQMNRDIVDSHDSEVTCVCWSGGDAWVAASVSCRGKVVVGHVDTNIRYDVLLTALT
eukprot:GHVR01165885.1.p2 GENE.GHVR01165885.1~~GHVR01165885.1.p2  ORF type:complete len:119 (+),score=72.00 GHVR01165885.1:213-569(+)